MGQIISAEDVIWYNANAWRKLSNTYLHQVRYGEEVNISLDNSLDENVNTFQEYQGGSPGGGQRSRPLSPLTSNNSSYASPQRAFHHRQQFATDTNGERRLYSSKTNLEVESGDRNGGGRIGEKIFGKRNADGQDGRSGSSASSSDQLDNSNLRQGVMLKNLSTSIGGGAGGTPRVMGRRKERQLAHADTSSPGVQRHYLNKSGAGVVAVPMTRLQDTNGSLESTDWMSSDDDDEEEAETTLGREWNAHDGTRRSHGVSSNRLNKTTGGGTNRINKTMPPVFAIQSKEALPPLGYTSSSEASGVKASRARHAQGSQHVRNYYSGGDRKYSAIEERRRRKLGGGGVDDGRPRKTNHLSMFKWTLGVLALVNLGCSIWAGIYMQLAYNWIERGLPIQGKLYDLTDSQLNLWKGLIIAGLVLMDLVQIWLMFALIFNHYWLVWAYTVLSFGYGGYGALSEMSRGSYVSWMAPLVSGVVAIIVTHKMAVQLRLRSVMDKYYVERDDAER